MRYVYNPGSSPDKPTFLLFHGTGGRETDLLWIAQRIDVRNGVLGLRGDVIEEGQRRYFKRFVDGSPDVVDLIEKTRRLNHSIDELSEQNNFERDNAIAIGYSNGANIAVSLMMHHEKALKGAILFHPMVPREGVQLPDLTGTHIFMSAGATDALVLPGETMKLKKMLEEAGAHVKFHITDYGHELTESDAKAAIQWYREYFSADYNA